MTRSKVKVTCPSQLEFRPFSTAIYTAIYNGSWQLMTISKFDQVGFLIFHLVFVMWLKLAETPDLKSLPSIPYKATCCPLKIWKPSICLTDPFIELVNIIPSIWSLGFMNSSITCFLWSIRLPISISFTPSPGFCNVRSLKDDMQRCFLPNRLKVVSSCLLQYKHVCVTHFDKLCRKMLKCTSLMVFLV